MYIVMAGGGEASVVLSNMLLTEGHEVVIIEKNKEVAEKVANEFKGMIINGDATKVNILKSANIESADVVFALTNDDITNFVFCVLAKKLGVPKAISIANDPEKEKLFRGYGIDATISPGTAIASYLKNLVGKPGFITLLSLAKKADILELTIPENAKVVGNPIKKLNLPKGCTIVAILRNDEIIIPTGSAEIKAKDRIIAFSKIEFLENLRKILTEK